MYSISMLKVTNINDNKGLGCDQVGELLIKSPSIMQGYLNNEKDTGEAIDVDGFLHTGFNHEIRSATIQL